MRQVMPIFKRELTSYFRTPVAYVFLAAFSVLSVGLAFLAGHFFIGNQASLDAFFVFMPWLFLFLIPATGMRLWAEERRSGTAELLFTLPVTKLEAVLGKFFAAWTFIGVALFLSFPMVLTVDYLGEPDWGVICTSYLGTFLMAGSYLGICSLTSALTKNQVISFVLSFLVCFILLFLGWDLFSNALLTIFHFPVWLVDLIANFSFITHFNAFMLGIVDPKDVVFFLSLAGFCLFLNVVALER